MPKFAANVTTMFRELPFPRRFDAAAACGFAAVEMQFPYQHPPQDVAAWAQNAGVEMALLNAPPGDWDAGDRGLAAIPGREAEFRESFAKALRYAEALHAPPQNTKIHIMAGLRTAGASRDTYVRNLRWASEHARGRMLVIEAINPFDMPEYLVSRQEHTASVVEEIGAANLRMQMDCYHMGRMNEDPAALLTRYRHLCGHVQIASVPERHEPDEAYLPIFAALDECYDGWVGCEYNPRGDTWSGLGWLRSSGQSRSL